MGRVKKIPYGVSHEAEVRPEMRKGMKSALTGKSRI
jgi:hypothetical protein